MRRRGSPALPAFLLVAASAALAAPPKVMVVVTPLDDSARGVAGAFEHAAEEAVTKSERLSLYRAVDAVDEAASRKRRTRGEQGDNAARQAQARMDELDAEKAVKLATDALSAYREADLSRSFDGLVRVWTLKAAAHAAAGDVSQARLDIEKILAIAPRATFPEQYMPPELLKFADSQRRLVSTARGELVVKSEPAGAQVYVDGTFRGAAPVSVKGLPGGRHVVVVMLGGYAMAQSEVALGEEVVTLAAAPLTHVWRGTTNEIRLDPFGPGRDEGASELGRQLGVEQVLAVTVRKSLTPDRYDVTATRLDVGDGHNFAWVQGTMPIKDLAAIEAWLHGALSRDEPRSGGPVHHYTSEAGVGSARRTGGLWTLASGAALIATGAFFGVQALNAQAAFKDTLQVETAKSAAFAGKARAYGVMADVFIGSGAVAAAVGSILSFTRLGLGGADEPATPSPEPPRVGPKRFQSSEAPPADGDKKADERAARKTPRRFEDDAAAR